MATRTCTGCKEVLPATSEFFNKSPNNKAGLHAKCRTCRKKYRLDNREKILKQKAEYREKNREKIREADREFRKNNKEKRVAKDRAYYQNNKETILARNRIWNKNNREHLNRIDKKRRQTNPSYRILTNLRKYLNKKVRSKSQTTIELIGCSPDKLRQHLEAQWTEGMSWDNYGVYIKGEPMKWHIDHIIPCDSFDLTDETEQAECFHYSNLQPMWGIDNIRKSNACSK